MFEESINFQKIENFNNLEKEIRKKKIKHYLIIIAIILILLIIIGISIYFIVDALKEEEEKKDVIKCKFLTLYENETIKILNEYIYKDLDFDLKINETDVKNNYIYTFHSPGEHKVTFTFKKN